MGAIAEIASAYVSLIPSMRGAKGAIDKEITPAVNAVGRKSGLSFGKLFAAGAALGLGAKAFSFLGDSLEEGREANKVSALVANAIKATGGAANVTAKQVDRLATSISKKTGIDDEQIATASSLILTFKNVANEGRGVNAIFDRTTQAAVDLSAAGFGSVDGAAKQLGKALNDPIKGMSALSRSGVTFTAEQQKQIKALVATGDLLSAQKVILAEVNGQVGGAAAATATASDKAAVAAGNLKEQVGVALIPVVDRLAATFTTTIIPAISGFVTGMTTGTGAGGQLVSVVTSIGSATAMAAGFINQHKTALTALAGAITAVVVVTKIHTAALAIQAAGGLLAALKATTLITSATKAYAAVQWILNAALTANPIGIIIVGLVALGAGLVLAYKKSETFRKIVDAAFASIKTTAMAVASFFTSKVPAAFAKVQGAASAVFGWVKSNWPTILAILTGPFGLAALAIAKNWDAIKDGGLRVMAFINGIPGKIAAVFTGAATVFYNAGVGLMQRLKDGIEDKIQDAIATVQAGLQKIKNLLPGSPIKDGPLKGWNGGTPGKLLMEMLARGLKIGSKSVQAEMTKVVDKLGKSLDSLKSKFSSLQSDFESIASGVSSAFNPDVFGLSGKDAVTETIDGITTVLEPATTALQEFMGGLTGNNSNLTAMLAAFDQLKAAGASSGFLSALFQSGNTQLATQLATAGPNAVKQASALFDQNASLAATLGNAVATNELGPKMDSVRAEITELRNDMKRLLPLIAKDVKEGAREGTKEGNDDRSKKSGQRKKAGR